ncbi:TetR/AcrR family transcriptional regulator C-terminal domain-containing protein [Streptomyces sp. SPB162]|uniref:TetR/AcrR family transcriptional regulator C-terminal domain-containing protein n=1 Tax=Streptomyces sp. SPB162 TaxID=2940560 RepID=UPI002405B129|nr:TetR/AcrR family transcriptional regulator C-terminal domain-containing protein [Streptomyces sp. SPB162]MDF9811243.1 hypothetical protein [Streptomyces sp. SPB162]
MAPPGGGAAHGDHPASLATLPTSHSARTESLIGTPDPRGEHSIAVTLRFSPADLRRCRFAVSPALETLAAIRVATGEQGRAAMRRHTWVPGLLISRPSLGPNALRVTEYFLGAMEPTGLDGPAMMEAFTLLNGFVCQFAEWEHASSGQSGGGEDAAGAPWAAEVVAYLQGVALSGRYPRLTRALAGSGPPPDADTVFERSLDRLLTVLTQPPG